MTCTLCSQTASYCEIVNSDDQPVEVFPEVYKKLIYPDQMLKPYFAYNCDRILICPECRSYYSYHQWSPGGSEDFMKTYNYESYKKVPIEVARRELQRHLEQMRKEREEPIYRESYAACEEGFQKALNAVESSIKGKL